MFSGRPISSTATNPVFRLTGGGLLGDLHATERQEDIPGAPRQRRRPFTGRGPGVLLQNLRVSGIVRVAAMDDGPLRCVADRRRPHTSAGRAPVGDNARSATSRSFSMPRMERLHLGHGPRPGPAALTLVGLLVGGRRADLGSDIDGNQLADDHPAKGAAQPDQDALDGRDGQVRAGLSALAAPCGRDRSRMSAVPGELPRALGTVAPRAVRSSPGARAHYDRRRADGDRHTAAQRNLFNRMLGCLHHCLTRRTVYDEGTVFPPSATPLLRPPLEAFSPAEEAACRSNARRQRRRVVSAGCQKRSLPVPGRHAEARPGQG